MITWLASYPRSGNTFLRTLLHQGLGLDTCSLYNDADIGGNPALAQATGHRKLPHRVHDQGFDLAPLRRAPEAVYLKTHELSPQLVAEGDRVIYIVRDGREATVSHVRYQRDILQRPVTALELLLGIHFPGGAWADHVREWAPLLRDDILLLRFEDMVARPLEALDRLAAFTGTLARGQDLPDFADLQGIDPRFFSSGRTDSWREELDEAAQTLFWLRSHREMSALGYLEAAPQWVGGDAAPVRALGEALDRAAVDLATRIGAIRTEGEEARTSLEAHIAYRDRLVRSLREELEPRSRELDLLRTQVFQLQDELAFYYRAFTGRDDQLEKYLSDDPCLRLARTTRGAT